MTDSSGTTAPTLMDELNEGIADFSAGARRAYERLHGKSSDGSESRTRSRLGALMGREEVDESSSVKEKVASAMARMTNRFMDSFERGNFVKKSLLVAGVLGLGYLAAKGVKKAAETVYSGLRSLFDLGGWFTEKVEGVRDATKGSVLKTLLGGVLGAGVVGSLWEAIRGRFGLGEITDAYADGGVLGIGALLLKKQKDGVIHIGKGIWDSIAGVLGLPKFETIEHGVEQVREGAKAATREASEAAGRLREDVEASKDYVAKFYETSGLRDMKDRAWSYFDEQYPGWRDQPSLRWVKDLGDPKKVLLDGLSLTTEKIKDYVVNRPEQIAMVVGLGTGYAVLRQILGGKWANLLTLNAATYAFLSHAGIQDVVHEKLNVLKEIEVKVAEKMETTLSNFGLDYDLVGLEKKFSVAEGIGYVIDIAAEHPESAFVTMTLTEFALFSKVGIARKVIGFLAQSMKTGVSVLLRNPRLASYLVAGGAIMYLNRKDVLRDLAEYLCDTDEEKRHFFDVCENIPSIRFKEFENIPDEFAGELEGKLEGEPAFLEQVADLLYPLPNQERTDFLASFQGLSRTEISRRLVSVLNEKSLSDPGLLRDIADLMYLTEEDKRKFIDSCQKVPPDSFAQKITNPLYQRLVADNVEALADGEVRMHLFKKLNDGEAFLQIRGGVPSLALLFQGSWQFFNLSLGAYEGFVKEFSKIGDPDGDFNIYAALALGYGSYVFGKASLVGTWKGYSALLNPVEHGFNRVTNVFLSLIPVTRQGRHIWRELLRQGVDAATFGQFIPMVQASRVYDVSRRAERILDVMARDLSGSATESELQGIAHEVMALAKRIEGFSSEGLYDDIALKKQMDRFVAMFNDAKGLSYEEYSKLSVEQKQRMYDHFVLELNQMKTRYSRILEVGYHVTHLKFSKAAQVLRESRRVRVSVRAKAPGLRPDELFRGKTPADLRITLSTLQAEILASGHPASDFVNFERVKRIQSIEAFLNPTRAARDAVDLSSVHSASTPEALRLELQRAYGTLEAREKGVYAAFMERMEDITRRAKAAGASLHEGSFQQEIQRLSDDLITPFAAEKQRVLRELHPHFKSLPGNLRRLVRPQLAEVSPLFRMTRAVGGRMKIAAVMAPLMFAVDKAIEPEKVDQDFGEIMHEFVTSKDMWQLFLDVLPGVGLGTQSYALFTGREWVSGRDVSSLTQRGIGALWLTASAASDILLVSGLGTPLGVEAKLGIAAGKGSKVAGRLAKLWPRISSVAGRMGGMKNFLSRAWRYMKNPLSRREFISGAQRVEKYAVRAGLAAVAGSMAYTFASGAVGNFRYEEMAGDIPSYDEDEGGPPESSVVVEGVTLPLVDFSLPPENDPDIGFDVAAEAA